MPPNLRCSVGAASPSSLLHEERVQLGSQVIITSVTRGWLEERGFGSRVESSPGALLAGVVRGFGTLLRAAGAGCWVSVLARHTSVPRACPGLFSERGMHSWKDSFHLRHQRSSPEAEGAHPGWGSRSVLLQGTL